MSDQNATQYILEASKLEVAYASSQVLFGMSLAVRPGEILALLGRNGAGKSTTLKALSGVLPTLGGQMRLQNKVINGWSPHIIARAGVGYVPEDRQIFSELSVQDNLDIATKSGADGHERWNLQSVYEVLPLLKTLKNRMGGLLSGGEQQLLTIGRCLMGNPLVMLLDEPSEGLAPIMVQKIGELIQALKQAGTTIILAEQNLHFCLGLADRAVVINRGVNVFEASVEELNKNSEVKRLYLSV